MKSLKLILAFSILATALLTDSGASGLTVLRRGYENTNRNCFDASQHDGIR